MDPAAPERGEGLAGGDSLTEVRRPRVELLWWEGCPSTDRASRELHEALDELGLAGVEVTMREIQSDDDARQAGFAGSPTILIDGIDCVGAGEEPAGLNCRIYHRRDGRISPTPDPQDLRAALRRAAERRQVRL